jgi:polar amino acid transport system permease protein
VFEKAKFKITGIDIFLLTCLILFFLWAGYRITMEVHYKWNWGAIPQYLFRYDKEAGKVVPGLIIQGVIITIRLSIYATILAMVIGSIMGLMRTSRNFFNRLLGWGYVEVIRNIPILVWIFIFYYFISSQIIPVLGIERLLRTQSTKSLTILSIFFGAFEQIPTFLSAMVALALYEGAYITEIVRAGIQSIEKGQWEAGAALGFSSWQRMRTIIFPQALQRILPPLAGQFISTIKDSAIVSVISISELTFQGMELMAASFLTFEVWITIMALYFIICLVCSLAVERFESFLQKSPKPPASSVPGFPQIP